MVKMPVARALPRAVYTIKPNLSGSVGSAETVHSSPMQLIQCAMGWSFVLLRNAKRVLRSPLVRLSSTNTDIEYFRPTSIENPPERSDLKLASQASLGLTSWGIGLVPAIIVL